MTCLRETFCGKIVIVKVCEGPKGPFFMLVGLFHESKAERLNTQGAFGAPFLLEVILSQVYQCDECGKTAHVNYPRQKP